MPEWLSLVGFGPKAWGAALLQGALLTVEIALMAFAIGLGLGLLGALAKLEGPWPVRVIVAGYTNFIRGVPEILVILLIYYGGTSALRQALHAIVPDATIEISPVAAGVAALAAIVGGYATELMRGAILAVPRGQSEAARALNLPSWITFWRIVLPQALRFALPGLGNLWLVTTKDAALVSVVGLRDLLGIAASGSAATRQPFLFYTAAALIFLCLSIVSMVGLHVAERAAERGHRRA